MDIFALLNKTKYIEFKNIQYEKWNLNLHNFLELINPETANIDYSIGLKTILESPNRETIVVMESPMQFIGENLMPIEFFAEKEDNFEEFSPEKNKFKKEFILHPDEIVVNIDSETRSAKFSKEMSIERMFPGIVKLMDDFLDGKEK